MAGYALIFGGDPEPGKILLEKAMELGPLDPSYFSHFIGLAIVHLFRGRPDIAAELAERSVALNAEWDSSQWMFVISYVQLGRMAEARSALNRLLEVSPGATISKYRKNLPFRDPAMLEKMLDSLRSAGLPK